MSDHLPPAHRSNQPPADDDPGPTARLGPTGRAVAAVVAIGALLAVVVILHLTGVLGPAGHR